MSQAIRSRLQRLFRGEHGTTSAASSTILKTPLTRRGRRRPPSSPSYSNHYSHHPHNHQFRTHTGLEVARFGLLSIATLPFTTWLALFTYDYVYRVEICQKALTSTNKITSTTTAAMTHPPPSSNNSNNRNKKNTSNNTKSNLIGRQAQIQEVQTLLSQPPHQLIVVAGPNESGKSHFIRSLLHELDTAAKTQQDKQGVILIPSSHPPRVDSLSTLTKALVQAFDLQWLHLRYSLVDVLPFAGSEILVMKERYSDRDLAQALEVITQALEQHQQQQQQQQPSKAFSSSSLTATPLRPVLIMDGLGEGGWFRGGGANNDGDLAVQQLLQWCVQITKERKLAHVILTGNEELVIRLTDQNRMTRGHVHVIGLSTLPTSQARSVIVQEWPDATPAEMDKLIQTLGGFGHDLQTTSRQIHQRLLLLAAKKNSHHDSEGGPSSLVSKAQRAQTVDQVLAARFRLQVERVTAAFAQGKDETVQDDEGYPQEESDDEEELDAFLDPLKQVYSEAQAQQQQQQQNSNGGRSSSPTSLKRSTASWSQLQLWRTLQRLVESASQNGDMAIPFGDLRDDVFDGDMSPLVELMNDDVLGFEIGKAWQGGGGHSSASISSLTTKNVGEDEMTTGTNTPDDWSWRVTPATPALGRVFQYLVQNSHLKERFHEMERVEERRKQLALNERERRQLRLERRRLDMRKVSLLQTAELGSALQVVNRQDLSDAMKEVYDSIVQEEIAMEQRGLELRAERKRLLEDKASSTISSNDTTSSIEGTIKQEETTATVALVPPPLPASDHLSIQEHLKAAILETCEQEGDRALKVRESFEQQSPNGMNASDIVRLIRNRTGDEIDLATAESFVQAWDANQDAHLDYDEFIDMILADHASLNREQRRKKKNKKPKTHSSSSRKTQASVPPTIRDTGRDQQSGGLSQQTRSNTTRPDE